MNENEIRPKDLHNEYIRLSKLDTEFFFANQSERNFINCPACDSAHYSESFVKDGFGFSICDSCQSLFQNPRPALAAFADFYMDSRSSTYWAKTFFPAVAEVRREKIFKPRAQKISTISSKKTTKSTVIDVGAGAGIFLEEFQKINSDWNCLALEPGKELADVCRSKGFQVLEKLAEDADDWKELGDVVTCFEVIEHAHAPLKFIESIFNLTRPGGKAVVTGLGVDGFDIQVLWDHSKAVSPPHHLNFLSVAGFESLFSRAGFSKVEVTTPGELDVDIVANFLEEFPKTPVDHFTRTLLKRGSDCRQELQNFLKKNKLSSHTWVIAEKD